MKKKILSGALAAALALSLFGGTALADKKGQPNARACHGQVVAALNKLSLPGYENGVQPPEIARLLTAETGERWTAGDVNKLIAQACAAL